MTGFGEHAVAREAFEDTSDYGSDSQVHTRARVFSTHGHAHQPANQAHQLARAIEFEVVPRLILARRGASAPPPPAAKPWPALRVEQVVELARLALDDDTGLATSYVETLHDKGTPVEILYLQLLAPAARHLGELWTDDNCTFTEVTVGLMRLQQVMRALSPAFQGESATPDQDHRILLTPVPGEQHSFGLFMVAEFFHRAGWHVCSGPLASMDELADAVHGQWFAVAGLSVSSEAKLEELVAAIRAIRRTSLNRAIGIMVGGQIFSEHPEMAAMVGADATAGDSQRAVAQAHGLLELRAGR